MKQFKSKITGEIITGTFKESTKYHKEMGFDWQIIKDDGKRFLFYSIQQFVDKYDESANIVFKEAHEAVSQFFPLAEQSTKE